MVLYFTQSRGNRTGITLERTVHRLLVQPPAPAAGVSQPSEPFRDAG